MSARDRLIKILTVDYGYKNRRDAEKKADELIKQIKAKAREEIEAEGGGIKEAVKRKAGIV